MKSFCCLVSELGVSYSNNKKEIRSIKRRERVYNQKKIACQCYMCDKLKICMKCKFATFHFYSIHTTMIYSGCLLQICYRSILCLHANVHVCQLVNTQLHVFSEVWFGFTRKSGRLISTLAVSTNSVSVLDVNLSRYIMH